MRTHALLKSDNLKTSVQPTFQLFFFPSNENRDFEIFEVDKIDFAELNKHLEKGESIFITHKRKRKSELIPAASKEMAEPWYFTHL
jgi:hypothetical protein